MQDSASFLTRLRNVLARTFPDRKVAEILAQDAWISLQNVDLAGAPVVFWKAILDEALKSGRMEQLLNRAIDAAPASTDLKLLHSEYLRIMGGTKDSSSNDLMGCIGLIVILVIIGMVGRACSGGVNSPPPLTPMVSGTDTWSEPPIADPISDPVQSPTLLQDIVTNRGPLLDQGQNGWRYQFEQGRNTGNFIAFDKRESYDGTDCYISPHEEYVRVCENGAVHPGQDSRVAYSWNSDYDGTVSLQVHAHKIDTRCGDGVWIGVFAGESELQPWKLDDFTISGSDNDGTTRNYSLPLNSNTYLLIIVDIRGEATCDQTRLFIDVKRN